MYATIILSILIFGAAGWIVYRQFTKGGSCDDCNTSCPVKKQKRDSKL